MSVATETPVKAVIGFISRINLVFFVYHAAVYFTLKSLTLAKVKLCISSLCLKAIFYFLLCFRNCDPSCDTSWP